MQRPLPDAAPAPAPALASSSSRHLIQDDVASGEHQQQSTKERRRERNRLAAQKHRLRRNERMNQLEQQVLALQQEKSILLARIDGGDASSVVGPPAAVLRDSSPVPLSLADRSPKAPPTPPDSAGSSSHSDDAGDDDDDDDDNDFDPPPRLSSSSSKRRRLSVGPPLSVFTAHSPSPAPSSSHQSLPPPSALTLHSPLPPIDDALAQHGHDAAYTRRLEDRIVELERWTEDLNGELADALDSHARNSDDLHHRVRRAQDQLAHAELQRAHALREADALREALDARAEDERHAQQVAQKLREDLESTEVTLDCQRGENDRLRDRLARLDDEAAREEKRLFRELRDVRAAFDRVEDENRHFRDLLRDRDAQLAVMSRARSVDSVGSGSSSPPSRKRKHDDLSSGEDVSLLSSRLSQTESLLASQSRQLQYAQSESEAREVDRRHLSEQVSYLQTALKKAGAFLTSKGIPLDVLEESDEED